MMKRLPGFIGFSCAAWAACAATGWAQDASPTPTDNAGPTASAPTTEPPLIEEEKLVWSLGESISVQNLRHPQQLGSNVMIGLRYGRWRSGVVDGENWHRFGQIKSDNNLTYDALNTGEWRTSLSAGIVNLQRDSRFDAFQPGRKTVRGKASIDYLGWPFWSVGLVARQDLLGRGAGTSLSPSVTYRKPVSEDSTILLTHAWTFSRSDQWRYAQQDNPSVDLSQPSRWGLGMDTSLTLRQRWKPHWSWFAQFNRGQLMRAGDPTAQSGQIVWSGQFGVVYFEH